MVQRIKNRGLGRDYDCLIGISGGGDSSYLLHWAKHHELRALAFHFDNGFNKDFAERNMKRMLRATHYPLVRISISDELLCRLNKAFLESNVGDVDIPNDIAMGKLMITVADKFGIMTILNGHSFRAEGSTPLGWTYMDGAYLEDIYNKFTGKELDGFPNLSILDQVKMSWKGIQHERPLYHINHDKEEFAKLLHSEYGWESYKGRHCENKYTEFAGYYIYEAFGIDKRKVELSANIRTGKYTKEQAKELLKEKVTIDPRMLYNILERINYNISFVDLFKKRKRNMFYEFRTYHKTFRRFRLLIRLGVALKLFPMTFYKKYTKKII